MVVYDGRSTNSDIGGFRRWQKLSEGGGGEDGSCGDEYGA